jgi:hypothetical protein
MTYTDFYELTQLDMLDGRNDVLLIKHDIPTDFKEFIINIQADIAASAS